MMIISHTSSNHTPIKTFIAAHHPLGVGGCLKGLRFALWGYEEENSITPSFLAVFVTPRAIWKHYNVTLELTRLVIAPYAQRSATTFLRACQRWLRKQRQTGLIVSYALPGTEGLVYLRAGWHEVGTSSGTSWTRRGPNARPTRATVGDGKKLKRFMVQL